MEATDDSSCSLSELQENSSPRLIQCSECTRPRQCDRKIGDVHAVEFVNHCGFGTPSLLHPIQGQLLSGRSSLSGPLVRGIGFLDQGACGSIPNLNCTSLDINLGGGESQSSYVRILGISFSVPVSFSYSRGCSSSGQCLDQTCSRHLLECRAGDASVLVTFCPKGSSLFPPHSTTFPGRPTTSPISAVHRRSLLISPTSSPSPRFLEIRASNTGRILGAELGGALGGAAFLLLVFIVFVWMRRRRARDIEARMPERQVPFVVNPTWVLASPTTPEGTHSHLSLPDRARPRTIPAVTPQLSMPNLATQYRPRVLRPRASTVGGGSVLARTESAGSREQSDTVGVNRSESSVWRPRIDILSARQHRAEGSGPGQPPIPMDSFWAE
ncbi:hypothetical protein DFH07DRAFT_1061715 [Mycena maculata]|uniref:Uncharacterized protein n=1 Tax=Mycena maculata TaxID=230809 RepID=A0AAD7IWT8_9AGAR|nr:hypothetical protein DFH07DRAFT_1061715 [Mycena maculata]